MRDLKKELIRYHEGEIGRIRENLKFGHDTEYKLKRIEYHEEKLRILKGEVNDH